MAVIRADPGPFDAFRHNGEKQRFAKTRFAKKTFAKKGFFRSGFPIRGALRQMIANKGLAFAKPSPQKTRLVQIIDSPL